MATTWPPFNASLRTLRTGIIVFCIVHTFASMVLFAQFSLCRILVLVFHCIEVHKQPPSSLHRQHYCAVWYVCIYIYILPPHSHSTTPTTDHHYTQCKLLERMWSMCASGWKERDHQCKLQQVAPSPVQGVFAPMTERKTLPAQVADSDHHHVCKWSTCAGWQKDNITSTRCKGQDTRCKGQDQHQRKSVSDAVTIFNHNHHHHWSGPTQHDAAITCIMAHE